MSSLSSMNQLVLDLSDPDVAKALENCETGEHVEFTVGGALTKTGEKATVELDEVKYTGSDGAEGSPAEEAKESPEDEQDEQETGMDKPAPKRPPAVYGKK